MPVEFISATQITPIGDAQGHNLAGRRTEARARVKSPITRSQELTPDAR
jgi:hypothetical protein